VSQAANLAPLQGRQPATPAGGARVVPAGGGSSPPLPGGSGIMPAGTMTGVRGASLQAGPAPAGGTPPLIGAKSREAWPDAEPLGRVVRQARAGAEGRRGWYA